MLKSQLCTRLDCIHSYSLTGSETESPNCITELKKFIMELDALYKSRNYIFRGQSNKDHPLCSASYRHNNIKKQLKEFDHVPYREWLFSKKTQKIISLYTNNAWTIRNQEVIRIFNSTIYVMSYNYKLSKSIKENKEKFDSRQRGFYSKWPSSHWENEDTFYRIFDESLRMLLAIIDLDGNILKGSSFYESPTNLDESLAQHFGTPTSILDWTLHPYKAIFFALENIPPGVTHCSLYVYQELKSSENDRVVILPGNPNIRNPRIKAQEGLFTYIKEPFLFHFFHERFPCIEDMIPISNNFALIKYDIPICHLASLRDFLNKNNISKKTLYPN